MGIKPLDILWQKQDIASGSTDLEWFRSLILMGEFTTKLIVLSTVSFIEDEPERYRYVAQYDIVRADSLGSWLSVLDNVLTGPASAHFIRESHQIRSALTYKSKPGDWQHEAYDLLHRALLAVDADVQSPNRPSLRDYFRLLCRIRNRTLGHGATPVHTFSRIAPLLRRAIELLVTNFPLFEKEFAYLHQNYSGKYNIAPLSRKTISFDYLQKKTSELFPDGVYVFLERPIQVQLIKSTVDILDYHVPNGAFNEKSYEELSYITDDIRKCSAKQFLEPVASLPASETTALSSLDVQEQCFGNIPRRRKDYIERPQLQEDLEDLLLDEHHQIITLHGRGGVGKTWLALNVLWDIAKLDRFKMILWFSARDIDLFSQGPKPVKPDVLSITDIASEFTSLLLPTPLPSKPREKAQFLSEQMTKSGYGDILFVFDNFETLSNPQEFFLWIDRFIRPNNKILITTRFRDFKADFPIEVPGMLKSEFQRMIDEAAIHSSVTMNITKTVFENLYRESEGHPYVGKILLGEIAQTGSQKPKIKRIVASKDNLLEALFERTFISLSRDAKRIFLTLSNWKSSVALIALEAILLDSMVERIDVDDCIEELSRFSLVEVSNTEYDSETIVTTPTAAALFGRKKIETSSDKLAIEEDSRALKQFGALQITGSKDSLKSSIEKWISSIAQDSLSDDQLILDKVPQMELVARKFAPAWLMISKLYEESDLDNRLFLAQEAIRRFIEQTDSAEEKADSWRRLSVLCSRNRDYESEIRALVEQGHLPNVEFYHLSNCASTINYVLYNHNDSIRPADLRDDIKRLILLMEDRIENEGTANDYSKMAWLCLHLSAADKSFVSDAENYARLGLKKEPDNIHCIKILEKLELARVTD